MNHLKQTSSMLLLAVLLMTGALCAFAGGDGTATNPFQITTASELNTLRNYLGSTHTAKYFKLLNDIDLTAYLAIGGEGYTAWGTAGWLPIGGSGTPFCGHFDGDNHKITGLKIDRAGFYECAFWSYTQTGSTIENLSMETAVSSFVSGYRRNGMMVGTNLGTISKCSVSGTVKGGLWSGLLVGWNDGTINNCSSNGNVAGTDNTIGGLVGQHNGTMSNSYSRASVAGAHYIGGLVGYQGSGSITNCYATGFLTGGQIGGLCGASAGTVTNSFWDKETSGIATSYGGTGKTTAEMKVQSTYTSWDFIGETYYGTNDIWGVNPSDNSGYPFLKWQGYTHLPSFKYVTQAGAGLKDGSSWANAYDNTQLQTAISYGPNQVWVAAGTYKPITTTDRTISFIMKNGVAIYGGFTGTETSLEQRNIGLNPTILSGDIGTTAVNTDNSYHVVYNNQNGLNGTAVLDGFTVISGKADGASPHNFGAGIYLNSSSPTIVNCTIKENNAASAGAGIYGSYSCPVITNCQITDNYGKGIFLINGSPLTTITNCTIANNSSGSDFRGGGLDVYEGDLILNNCIFWGNTSSNQSGNQICFFGGNRICTINNSCYANGEGDILIGYNSILYATNSNITTNPGFVNPAIKDYRVWATSPCLDAGNNDYNTLSTDIRGSARKLDKTNGTSGTIDMGAFEYKFASDPFLPYTFVTETGAGLKNGSSWANAYDNTQLQTAINTGISQVWVAAGTYKPTTTTDRTISFVMKNNLSIYGGFAGGETSLDQRNIAANPTILSADIGIAGNQSDNSYHVVYNNQNGLNNSAVLDGFTISHGQADGTSPHNAGAGIYLKESSPSIINCAIKSNSSPTYVGGGISSYYTTALLINCQITDNLGGGISMQGTSASYMNMVFTNCTIANNASGSNLDRGGIWSRYINLTLNNCIIWGNTSIMPRGKQIAVGEGSCTINYSCYANGLYDVYSFNGGVLTATNNNITADPSFIDSAIKDYRIYGNSPCADTGLDSYNTLATDIRSIVRKLDKTNGSTGTIDMGAYEYKFGTDPFVLLTAPIIAQGESIFSETYVNLAKNIILDASDDNPADILVWSIQTQAVHGNASMSAKSVSSQKSFVYTPELNYVGIDSFIVRVSDGVLYDDIKIHVRIISPETAFPWLETFEDDSPNRSKWTQVNISGANNWIFATGDGNIDGAGVSSAHGGTLNARCTYSNSYNNFETRFVTPALDLSLVINPQVKFYYAQADWLNDINEFKVYYKNSVAGVWTQIFHDAEAKGVWTESILDLPEPTANYQIAFESIDQWGYSNILDDVEVYSNSPSVIDNNLMPTETKLYNNYPNPFNPATTIKFDLKSAGQTKLVVYNAKGEMVKTLINGMQNAGRYSVNFDGLGFNSGVYFYKLEADGKSMVKRMLMVK